MELLTIRQTQKRLSIGRTTLWKLAKDDKNFPQPVQVTPGRKSFVAAEIDKWIAAQVAKRDGAVS